MRLWDEEDAREAPRVRKSINKPIGRQRSMFGHNWIEVALWTGVWMVIGYLGVAFVVFAIGALR